MQQRSRLVYYLALSVAVIIWGSSFPALKIALSLLPQAVVIAGGVAEKTPALVRHEEFAREFGRAAGAHGDFLSRVPVWLNRHPQSGLWGAAEAGAMLAHGGGKR